MAGYSYTDGGGWTSCGWAETPAFNGVELLWGQRNPEKLRVWKWTGPHGDIESPIMVATNDEMVLHILAGALKRELGDGE